MTCSTSLSCNGWQIIAVVPKSVLTDQIGTMRYVTVALCFVSVFIGMIVCLAYWHQRKGMVQEFFALKDRILQGRPIQKEHLQFWRSFDSFLTEVEQLQNTVEQQETLLQESFLGKMLYGSYDSEKQLEAEAKKAGFPLEKGFYYVVDMQFEDPLRSGVNVSREEFGTLVDHLLTQYITWNYWRYSVSELSVVLLIQNSEELPATEIKRALEEMNYEFYSCLEVQSYTGISTAVREPLEIARQYEIASRISEFARYRGIRVPVLPGELPREQALDQPLFMTIDMELKLVKQIQSGSAEQLEELIEQIKKRLFPARKQSVHLSPYHRNSAGLSVPQYSSGGRRTRGQKDPGSGPEGLPRGAVFALSPGDQSTLCARCRRKKKRQWWIWTGKKFLPTSRKTSEMPV